MGPVVRLFVLGVHEGADEDLREDCLIDYTSSRGGVWTPTAAMRSMPRAPRVSEIKELRAMSTPSNGEAERESDQTAGHVCLRGYSALSSIDDTRGF